MKFIKKFKIYFNKENSDFSHGYVDPFEFHKTFHFVLVAFKVADIENKLQPTLFNQNLVIFISGVLASIAAFISLLHGVHIYDIPHITEAGTYFIIMFYEILILSCTKINVPQYHSFLNAMKTDFDYICSTGKKYRKQFFANQLKTWKICIFACIFTASLSIGMNIFTFLTLFYFAATHKSGDGAARPLLFPFWFNNLDLSASPTYEVAFCFSNICALLYSYNYIFMLQTQIVWVRHITSKADIVTWSIEDLLVGVYPARNSEEKEYYSNLIQRRLRSIVIQHQSMYSLLDDYAVVYKKLLLFEQNCCGPVACLTAYCLVQKLGEGEFNAILALLFIGTVVLYFIPSYLCTFLTLKVRSICDACWGIPFWNADPVIRSYMVLIMQRSLRRLPLHAPGFQDISLQTFSRKMTSAYTYFNMLRQANL